MGVDLLLALNRQHADFFEAQAGKRREYWTCHNTEISAEVCMDERVDFVRMAGAAEGIYQQRRSKGGHFDLGYGRYGKSVVDWFTYARSKGRECIVIATEHYSKSNNTAFGCRGFKCDRNLALASARRLRDQYAKVFRREPLYPLAGSIDTDEDGFTFSAGDGKSFDLASVPFSISNRELLAKLNELYPDMPHQMQEDLIPLARGIIRQIARVRQAGGRAPEDVDHGGWVLAVGIGADDWLREQNTAIKVSPYGPGFCEDLEVAANILWSNWKKGQKSDYGMVLMTTMPFRPSKSGFLQRIAEEHVTSLAQAAQGVIMEKVPELFPHLAYLTAVMDVITHRLHVVSRT